ncbi:MAG: radical SAM protein [Bacteroidales bacterium]|jgi:wyosine [tRNA(Phe)-imidazoG37] synthetase (radical SAM superfamily)|nr:radical SAM protein [Bacteroidales bacterium]
METHLFNSIIFGPVNSRRLGLSLGINLLPVDKKICSFNCVYCECGLTDSEKLKEIPSVEVVSDELEKKLKELIKDGKTLNSITYAGNGEPTLHPDFDKILKNSVELRNKFAPEAIITVITNSSQLYKPKIANSLQLADKALLKLDTTDNNFFKKINRPAKDISIDEIMSFIENYSGKKIIQTMFLRANFNGELLDNTTETSLKNLASFVSKIKAEEWMIYPIDRPTPEKFLTKIGKEEMDEIGGKLKKLTSVPITIKY